MSGVIKIMLVEKDNLYREGLAKLLETDDRFRVVAQAGTMRQALQNISPEVDILLLDTGLPDGDGLDLCAFLKDACPSVKIIILAAYDDVTFIRRAAERGVKGFVPKYAFFEDVRSAITMVFRGGAYLYPGLQANLLWKPLEPALTEAEVNILQFLARGESQKEVAEKLFVSISTLRRRIKGICAKLGAASLEEALVAAARRGLVR
ncbi:MAG: response regulator [Desulfotomaculales bacterium]